MRERCLLILVFFLLINFKIFPQDIKVRIFSQYETKSFVFTPVFGEYFLISGTDTIKKIKKLDIINIVSDNDSVIAKQWLTFLCKSDTIRLVPVFNASYFRIKSIIPDLKVRYYEGELIMWADSISHNIIAVNKVNLEKYVQGVIESEAGSNAALPLEYLKTQAVISRTYALKNKGSYNEQGYDLCDNINCQAYYGKSLKNRKIIRAVNETKGLVIVDTAYNLIYSVFHSNSGGETANSYTVWNDTLPYLKSVLDSFSVGGKNFLWQFSIKKKIWLDYLEQKGIKVPDNYNFTMKMEHRVKYLKIGKDSLKTTEIRKDWGLKSAFFDIVDHNNYIKFFGRGFGHGVGLCQEGAIRMAKEGFNFREILNYYYTDIKILPFSDVVKIKSNEINN